LEKYAILVVLETELTCSKSESRFFSLEVLVKYLRIPDGSS